MFPIYPGFEDLSLRIEVEWEGRKRQATTRVAQSPASDMETAVIVCSFEDDAESGEWIITDRNGLYLLSAPQKRIVRRTKLNLTRPHLSRSTHWDYSSEKSIRLLVQGTFNGGIARHKLARILYLPELPAKPKVVIDMPDNENLLWCPTEILGDSIPFKLADKSTRLASQMTEAYAQLRSAWQDTSSDVHFAWKWSGLNKNEKYLELTGLHRRSEVRARIEGEMQRVMRLILINYELWGPDEEWSLYFDLARSSVIGHEDGRLEKNDQHLYEWRALLLKYLMPQFRHDWLEKHPCVWDCWTIDSPSANVKIECDPTAHEQIEAKLALRDWLKDKATPAVAARLLASLDD